MTTKRRSQLETEKALKICDYKCVVCGWSSYSTKKYPLVVGAHVKPYADLEEDTYEDIIALCPNCHSEFDNHLFYISNDGENKVSMTEGVKKSTKLYRDVRYIKKEYLAYREYQFNKHNN